MRVLDKRQFSVSISYVCCGRGLQPTVVYYSQLTTVVELG